MTKEKEQEFFKDLVENSLKFEKIREKHVINDDFNCRDMCVMYDRCFFSDKLPCFAKNREDKTSIYYIAKR